MEELIKRITEALVDNPAKVSVQKIGSDRTVIYELRVAKEDIGKVIGQHGRNIDAIRTILNAASAKVKKRSTLELIEDDRTETISSVEPTHEGIQDKSGEVTGIVRWFNDIKGYGFITVDDGEDVFVHYKSIEESDQSLMEGDRVAFDVIQGDKGPRAVNVRRISS